MVFYPCNNYLLVEKIIDEKAPVIDGFKDSIQVLRPENITKKKSDQPFVLVKLLANSGDHTSPFQFITSGTELLVQTHLLESYTDKNGKEHFFIPEKGVVCRVHEKDSFRDEKEEL